MQGPKLFIDKVFGEIDSMYLEAVSYGTGQLRMDLLKMALQHTDFSLMLDSNIDRVNDLIISTLTKPLVSILEENTRPWRQEYQQLKTIPYQWNQFYLDYMLKIVSKDQDFISLGCGSGHIETLLDNLIKAEHPDFVSTWLGMDHVNYLKSDSVIASGGKFVLLPSEYDGNYLDLITIKSKEVIVLVNFVAHHLIISPKELLNRLQGASRIILIDELAPSVKYAQLPYRTARVGWDLVSNLLANPGWSNRVLDKESPFHVDYWTFEEASKYFTIINFPFPHKRLQILDSKLN